MSEFNHVERVTLTIELASGEHHKLISHNPKPTGGNPRFLGQQVENAVDALSARAKDLMTSYGDQIKAAS